ncbi:hypothetical protein V6L77_22695 [Pannonibacter sp. Pt2-lr]
MRVRTTHLGAHALPPEYKGREDAYLDEVCLPGLRRAAAEGLVDAVDGFCEGIAFSVASMRKVFDEARRLGLPVKLHAEQLSHLGGTKLAADYGALSADHVEYATDEDAAALPAPARLRCCCPVPSMPSARRRCRRSPPSAPAACRWRWRRIATPARPR